MDKSTISQIDIKTLVDRAAENELCIKSLIMIELPIDTILAMDVFINDYEDLERDNFVAACIEIWLQKT